VIPILRRAQALALDGQMRQLAKKLKGEQSLLVFGRGYNFATALEAALKVKEVALMHRWGCWRGSCTYGDVDGWGVCRWCWCTMVHSWGCGGHRAHAQVEAWRPVFLRGQPCGH
jgi:hypothetical protein